MRDERLVVETLTKMQKLFEQGKWVKCTRRIDESYCLTGAADRYSHDRSVFGRTCLYLFSVIPKWHLVGVARYPVVEMSPRQIFLGTFERDFSSNGASYGRTQIRTRVCIDYNDHSLTSLENIVDLVARARREAEHFEE